MPNLRSKSKGGDNNEELAEIGMDERMAERMEDLEST